MAEQERIPLNRDEPHRGAIFLWRRTTIGGMVCPDDYLAFDEITGKTIGRVYLERGPEGLRWRWFLQRIVMDGLATSGSALTPQQAEEDMALALIAATTTGGLLDR